MNLEDLFEGTQQEGLAMEDYPSSNHSTAANAFPWRHFLGTGALVALILLVGAWLWTMHRSTGDSEPLFKLHGPPALIARLQRGSLVSLSGVEIGRVTSIANEPSSDGSTVHFASLQFHDGIERRLGSDTRFRVHSLSSKGPGNVNVGVEVLPGTMKKSPLPKDLKVESSNESAVEWLEAIPLDRNQLSQISNTLWSLRLVFVAIGLISAVVGFVYRSTRSIIKWLIVVCLTAAFAWLMVEFLPSHFLESAMSLIPRDWSVVFPKEKG